MPWYDAMNSQQRRGPEKYEGGRALPWGLPGRGSRRYNDRREATTDFGVGMREIV